MPFSDGGFSINDKEDTTSKSKNISNFVNCINYIHTVFAFSFIINLLRYEGSFLLTSVSVIGGNDRSSTYL